MQWMQSFTSSHFIFLSSALKLDGQESNDKIIIHKGSLASVQKHLLARYVTLELKTMASKLLCFAKALSHFYFVMHFQIYYICFLENLQPSDHIIHSVSHRLPKTVTIGISLPTGPKPLVFLSFILLHPHDTVNWVLLPLLVFIQCLCGEI